jgi:hypothetical protein
VHLREHIYSIESGWDFKVGSEAIKGVCHEIFVFRFFS